MSRETTHTAINGLVNTLTGPSIHVGELSQNSFPPQNRHSRESGNSVAKAFFGSKSRGHKRTGIASGVWLALPVALLVAALLTGLACGGEATTKSPTQGNLPSSGLTAVDIVRQLTPSVVHVFTEVASGDPSRLMSPAAGVGTGIILDEDGYVLTNNHVIAGADSITVTLHNGESYRGLLVGGDTNPDVAIIKIDASGLQPAQTGASSNLSVGEDVIAIGHALALSGGPTVSRGVISALGRSIDAGPQDTYVDLIQTDASINPGNSGGPLVNRFGEVIGVNTAAIQGGQGIGFAINMDDALTVSGQLIEKGYVERGFLGIAPINLTPAIAAQIGVPVSEGILVARVVENSGAQAAGLQGEDVIVALGGQDIRNTGDLSKFLLENLPGEQVTVRIYRGNSELEKEATLGERPAP